LKHTFPSSIHKEFIPLIDIIYQSNSSTVTE